MNGFRSIGHLSVVGEVLGASVAMVDGETSEKAELWAVYRLRGVKDMEGFLGQPE